MTSGLLWYDADAKVEPAAKILEAVARYQERFGEKPNCCHVPTGASVIGASLVIVEDRWLRPGFFWVGVDTDIAAKHQPAPLSSRRRARNSRGADAA